MHLLFPPFWRWNKFNGLVKMKGVDDYCGDFLKIEGPTLVLIIFALALCR